MKKFGFIIVLLSCIVAEYGMCVPDEQASEFVVKPKKKKKLSTNALKEKIGDTAKEALDHSTHLAGQLGSIQCCFSSFQQKLTQAKHEDSFFKEIVCCCSPFNQSLGVIQKQLSSLQNSFSQSIERIINNWRPFKKATKQVLHKSLDCVGEAREKLAQASRSLQLISAEMTKIEIDDDKAIIKQVKRVTSSLKKQEQVISDLYEAISADACLKIT